MSNTNDLQHQDATKKLIELVNEIETCLFCTSLNKDDGSTCRPMRSQLVDDSGQIWFFSGKDSDKNKEIAEDNDVQLYFSHPGKNSFLVVSGHACLSTDKTKIAQLWNPAVKAWFPGGKDDPNISLIKVKVSNAYYWDVSGNKMINFFKMVASAATGKMLIDAEEGTLKID